VIYFKDENGCLEGKTNGNTIMTNRNQRIIFALMMGLIIIFASMPIKTISANDSKYIEPLLNEPSSSILHNSSGPIINASMISNTNRTRIVGYFAEGDPFNEINTIDYSKLTVLIYSAAICKSDTDPGLLYNTGLLKTLVSKVHTAGSNILINLTGGNWNTWTNLSGVINFVSILTNNTLRSKLVANIVTMIANENLDGISIDWEGSDVTQPVYHQFLLDLRNALPSGKLISVAGCGNIIYNPWFNSTDAPLVDMFEVMLYDMAFPADATYDDYVADATLWLNNGFPAQKLDLGVPLYACSTVSMLTGYHQVIEQYNPAPSLNQLSMSTVIGWDGNPVAVNGGLLWWNGVNLAISKTKWAQANNIGGMMLFAVNYDALSDVDNLLTNIAKTLNTIPSITTSSLPNGAVGIPYSQILAATGGSIPYAWTIASGTLPTGLSLSSNGVISGTPTIISDPTSITFQVTDTANIIASKNLSITIGYAVWDVNRDGSINVLDMISLSQHLGETGKPGWILQDVNGDGVINTLDMIIIGQHWTG
jgi:hypothetical protein